MLYSDFLSRVLYAWAHSVVVDSTISVCCDYHFSDHDLWWRVFCDRISDLYYWDDNKHIVYILVICYMILIYRRLSFQVKDLGGHPHIFLWERRNHYHLLTIFCYHLWSLQFCYTLEQNKHRHNDVVSLSACQPTSCEITLMKHTSNISHSLHYYDATMRSSLRKAFIMK